MQIYKYVCTWLITPFTTYCLSVPVSKFVQGIHHSPARIDGEGLLDARPRGGEETNRKGVAL